MEFEDERLLREVLLLPEVWIRKLMICRLRSLILGICGTIQKMKCY